MTGNRVEQLESRVRELEATLNGLTDELVDTKDRLETVERALTGDGASGRRTDIVEGELLGGQGNDADADADGDGDGDVQSVAPVGNDSATGAQTEEESKNETENTESDTDGIIVA